MSVEAGGAVFIGDAGGRYQSTAEPVPDKLLDHLQAVRFRDDPRLDPRARKYLLGQRAEASGGGQNEG